MLGPCAAAVKDEPCTSPLKGQRRTSGRGSRRQQQQSQPRQASQLQQGSGLVPALASGLAALGSDQQLVPVAGGDLSSWLRAAGVQVGGVAQGEAGCGRAPPMLVGADLTNWLKTTAANPGGGSTGAGTRGAGSAPAAGSGLVGLSELSGWLKQQQPGIERGASSARPAPALQQSTPVAAGAARDRPFAQVREGAKVARRPPYE